MGEDAYNDGVTQEDVAVRAGVSRSVVSYVLNNGPRQVSEETRQRVLAAIRELGYRPNKHAQRLRWGSGIAQNALGIIAGGRSYHILQRSYYNSVLAGLFDGAHQFGQHVRFFSFFDALKDPVIFNKNIHKDEISSLVLILPSLIGKDPEDLEILNQIVERIDNIVCLEESVHDLPAVLFDRAAAARLAVEHLIGLGHRRIAFLAIEDARLTGYRQTLLEHGLPYDTSLVHAFDPARASISAYELTVDLLRLPDLPTAIFAANDEAAIAAMAALQDNGLRVPDDVAVASIDNIELASMVRPALTTVNIPKYDMGIYAVQFLISRRDFSMPMPASMVMPIELIVRGSCGAKRSS
ncbi:MAG TPA: LacI family DNA-binding transcriptional regulator [Aggregatilinea sp.]|jgi:DNA-binding LacI/PurR family transcriptional regulator|uniref:LacI family DNA-binding transcriptional regulator n=1 Tax=Aggregatilinea sp. TaxID=2806333 RepID=UPI002B6532C2|nr:LacI family DNA-binding transcriptional regulator [Aggregatilinea sp.]HML20229.1 LacI family DNA-binding transcriptional regulator [Aggregatilinea sp.]